VVFGLERFCGPAGVVQLGTVPLAVVERQQSQLGLVVVQQVGKDRAVHAAGNDGHRTAKVIRYEILVRRL
jgi:hypothetical protein